MISPTRPSSLTNLITLNRPYHWFSKNSDFWINPKMIMISTIQGEVAQAVQSDLEKVVTYIIDDLQSAIIGIISRRTMREDELVRRLKCWLTGKVDATLKELESSRRAQVIERYGRRSWSAASAPYLDEARSQTVTPGVTRNRLENLKSRLGGAI